MFIGIFYRQSDVVIESVVLFLLLFFSSTKKQFGFSNGKDCFLWYNNNTVAQLTENIFKTAHEKAGILWVI